MIVKTTRTTLRNSQIKVAYGAASHAIAEVDLTSLIADKPLVLVLHRVTFAYSGTPTEGQLALFYAQDGEEIEVNLSITAAGPGQLDFHIVSDSGEDGGYIDATLLDGGSGVDGSILVEYSIEPAGD
jgi:hypothetical protein